MKYAQIGCTRNIFIASNIKTVAVEVEGSLGGR
jgi:hypothetical protein